MMKKGKYLLLCTVLIGFVTKAGAPPPAPVCELYSRTIGDALIHPPMGGDFDTIYFTASIPNIAWVLDTSGSMRGLPCEGNCDMRNCGIDSDYPANYNPAVFLNMGYNPNHTYPPVFPECNANDDPRPCFDPSRIYRSTDGCYGTRWQETTLPSGGGGYRCQTDNQCYDQSTCNSVCGTGPCPDPCYRSGWRWICPCTGNRYSTRNACISACQNVPQCVSDDTCPDPNAIHLQTYGWVRIGSYWYFSGNLLNFYPPKYISARKAFYELLNFPEVRRVRMNLFGFDPPDNGAIDLGSLGRCLNPSCNMLDNQSAFDSNRVTIQNFLRNNGMALFRSATPLAEAVYNMGELYATYNYWVNVFGLTPKSTNPAQSFGSCTGNHDPVCEDFPCVKNFIVMVTDGLPCGDCNDYIPSTAENDYWNDRPVMDHDPVNDGFSFPSCFGGTMTDGTNVTNERSNEACLDDIAHFLNSHDFRPDRDGEQNIVSYYVGFGLGALGDPGILISAANKGEGVYIDAEDYQDLVKAIKDVLLDILRRTSAFTAAVVPKIRTSSAGGVIVGKFKPSKMPIWEGHLYKFALYSEAIADNDLNNDDDTEDTFLVDAEDSIIEENEEGNYVKKGTTNPAVPYWDAGNKLLEKPIDQRRIYTAIDINGDGRIDRSDGTIEFNEANTGLLAPYLVPDYPANCTVIGNSAGVVVTSPEDCATLVIKFIRGTDIFDYDSDGDRGEAREWILGDIMHSNPTEVGPPVLPRPCSSYGAQYAYPNCIMSLFFMKEGSGMAPLEFYPDEYDTLSDEEKNLLALHGGGYHAYNKFVLRNFTRKRIVLVGANDGMLHAFHSGTYQSCDINTAICNYDEGTGEELWAFIPPDLLPKLRRALFDHQVFVDATPMVRDVWVDLNDDYNKQWNEYKTVAIVGEREGGVHFSALDITDVENPQFLWIFPQPDDPAGNWMGQTWSDHLPHPPSIGPVKVEDASSPTGWKEKYVVALNGGFDDMDIRGRGVFIVDAYTGEKIWDYHFDPTATDSRRFMRYSFPASLGFASHSWFFGEQESTAQKLPLFDVAFAGDAGGQIWMFNLREPGNWFGYRVFEGEKASTLLRDKVPFFVIPALSPLHPYVWAVMMGSGDRKGMYKCTGSDCSTYNLRPCKREGCSVSITTHGRTSDNFTASQNVSNTSAITSDSWSLTENTGNSCTIDDYVNVDISSCINPLTPAKRGSLTCSINGDYISCTESSIEKGEINIANPLSQKASAFYSVRVPAEWIYDMGDHDDSRFTDSDLLNANEGETSPDKYRKGWRYTHQLDEIVGTSASIPMLKLEDVLKDGCVTWSTFRPNCGAVANPCTTAGAGEGWFYQANFFTGAEESKCREVFTQFGATRAILIGSAPPLPPTQSPTYSGGQLTFYTIITAPGTQTSMYQIGFGSSGLGGSLVYLMDVSRMLHENMCRARILGYPLASHPQDACQ